MNRFLLLFVAACLASTWTVATEAQNPDQIQNDTFQIPAIIKIGDANDRVREIQATLNRELADEIITLPPTSSVGDAEGTIPGVRKVTLPDKHRVHSLLIRGHWERGHVHKEWPGKGRWVSSDEQSILPEDHVLALKLLKNPPPLQVDGVYGQHTYASVMLFQWREKLPLSGEVDAVTLDKLEPLIPSNPLLAGIMSWVEGPKEEGAQERAFSVKDPLWVKRCTAIAMTLIILVVSVVVYQVARGLANSTKFLSRWLFTPITSPWITTLREKKAFDRLAQLAPALFIFFAAFVFSAPQPDDKFPYMAVFQNWHILLSRFGLAYGGLVFMLVALAVVESFHEVYTAYQPEDNPISGITRAAKRLVTLVGLVLVISALAGRNPMYIVGGLGAFMAVIMLVFKDSILGFVASIQIFGNKMVKIGDWIEMPKYGADGHVLEISLSIVKVQNLDKTISTIPTYALLSESFRNWSGIQSAGGRRIKRAVFIDMRSIKVCTPEMIERFEKIELIGDYIQQKKLDLKQYNDEHEVKASLVNSRRLTNIGTFRAYLEAYLSGHPKLNGEMTYLVRHLEPGKVGLPIEIYAFCSDTAWKEYEAVQADIFEHVLSILAEFDLRTFQEITDADANSSEDRNSREWQTALYELNSFVEQLNRYLVEHPSARVNVAERKLEKEIERLNLKGSVTISTSDRRLKIET